MNTNEKICRNVKALCKINGYMLGEVEKDIGMYPGFFSRKRNVSAELLIKIADKFEVSVMDLLNKDYQQESFETEELDKVYAVIAEMKKYMNKGEMMKWLITIMNLVYGDDPK